MKKNIYIHLFLLFCLLFSGVSAYSQKASVRATVSPADILIGEQSVLELTVIAPQGRSITLPLYTDTLISGIEVLEMLKPDTLIAHEIMTISQKYILTSFDSTLYHIPYIPVLDGTDTIKSNSFGLKVTSLMPPDNVMAYLDKLKAGETDSIDFNKLQLNDIKEVMQPPFVWQDYLSYLWLLLLGVVILAIFGVGLYLVLRKKNKGYFFKPEIILPPHTVAIQALDKIKETKIWQQGLDKQYYTEVTNILREYIEKRFYVNAFERTSDEILDAVDNYTETESSIDNLRQILKLADLVKFAKYKPLPNENDLSLVNAYLFVNQTKIEPKPVVVEGEVQEERSTDVSDTKGLQK